MCKRHELLIYITRMLLDVHWTTTRNLSHLLDTVSGWSSRRGLLHHSEQKPNLWFRVCNSDNIKQLYKIHYAWRWQCQGTTISKHSHVLDYPWSMVNRTNNALWFLRDEIYSSPFLTSFVCVWILLYMYMSVDHNKSTLQWITDRLECR
jgi:hypothetical protein